MVDQFEEKKLEERILLIKRVTKKITGGSHITFVAVVAVGDRKGKVGIGMGKGREVPQAIRKAFTKAQKKMITIPVYRGTIPHEVFLKYKAGVVFLKPAPEGTGLKVGSVIRTIFDLAGVYNVSGKIIGSRNQIVNTHLIMKAIGMLRNRTLSVSEGKKNE